METPRMFCSPRITSRCKGFGAAPSASKLNSLHAHYSNARVALAIQGVMICWHAMRVLGCAGPMLVYFSSQQRRRMTRPRIFATRPLFEEARRILQEKCQLEYWSEPGRISREALLSRVQGKQGLVCLLTERIDEAFLHAARELRIVANVAVGFDNINVPACTKHGVAATNTPGVLDETTADFAWTLMMAVARRLSEGA